MTTREYAIYFAGEQHKDQKYGEAPYVLHLSAVDRVLKDAGYEENHPVRIAAWLHDTIEDCGTTRDMIDRKFGPVVSQLVWNVSNEPGANRAERNLKTYPKIISMPESVALKLADRIANLEHSVRHFSRQGLMYVKEDGSFRSALCDPFYNDIVPIVYLWERYSEAVLAIKKTFGITI